MNKNWRELLCLLEHELLWFSLIVPALAVIAFACGGSCALWQWWFAAALVVLLGVICSDWRKGAVAGVAFLLWQGMIWLLCGILANPGGWDEIAYHFPAVRLLSDGWNPLAVRTPEAFRDAFGFVQGDMEVVHALFQMKGVWLFDAVAQKFTGEFFSPMLPLTLVLFPAVAIRVCRTVNGIAGRMLAVVVLYCIIPRSFFSLDAALALSAIGLMASMYSVVCGAKPDVLAMAGYTTWFAASKLNGAYQVVLVWAVFGCVVLAMRLPVKRLFVAIGLSILAFLPLGVMPFVTCAIDYGHPLYPHLSRDPAHPTVDICADFEWKRNDDIKSLGACASFVNAYVSPSLVRWAGSRLTGRDDFQPRNQLFEHYPGFSEDGGVTAVHWRMRLLFWLAVVFLCMAGGWRGRMIAIMALLGLVAVPTRMMGYIRYVPWALAPVLFSVATVSRMAPPARKLAFLATGCMLVVVRPLPIQRQLFDTAWDIYSGALAREYLDARRSSPPRVLYPPQSQRWRANMELTRRRFPILSGARVSDQWGDDLLSTPQWLRVFPGGFFGYDPSTEFPELEACLRTEPSVESKSGKLRFVARTAFSTVPRLAWRRLFPGSGL
jgi:hypothetical protein